MNYLIERLARVIYFAPSIKSVGYKSYGPYGDDATWAADKDGRERALDQARNIVGNLNERAEELHDRDIEDFDEAETAGWARLRKELETALFTSNQDPIASDTLGYSAEIAALRAERSTSAKA